MTGVLIASGTAEFPLSSGAPSATAFHEFRRVVDPDRRGRITWQLGWFTVALAENGTESALRRAAGGPGRLTRVSAGRSAYPVDG